MNNRDFHCRARLQLLCKTIKPIFTKFSELFYHIKKFLKEIQFKYPKHFFCSDWNVTTNNAFWHFQLISFAKDFFFNFPPNKQFWNKWEKLTSFFCIFHILIYQQFSSTSASGAYQNCHSFAFQKIIDVWYKITNLK